MTDFVYDPRCHSQLLLADLARVFTGYMDCMMLFYSMAFGFLNEQWDAILGGLVVGTAAFGVIKLVFLQEPDEPLTSIESDIVHYIHANASTGSTARMLYHYLNQNAENDPIDMDAVDKALKNLKRRKMLLPVQATLWLAAGN
jgi:hypothetical protein